MDIALAGFGLAFAACCVAVIGFATQRGSICSVAAVHEVIGERRFGKLLAILEAAAWIAGGLLIAHALGLLRMMPTGYALSALTLLGGALLGLGGHVNGACMVGTIARLGSGEWAFAATPAGFFLGSLTFSWAFPEFATLPTSEASPLLQAPGWLALPVAALMAWRIARLALAARAPGGGDRKAGGRSWKPRNAATVIAIAFLAMLLLAEPWAYTDTLAELARGMARSPLVGGALLLALLAGAVLGGWTAGRLAARRVAGGKILRCAAGGVIMAWGGLLLPGSNDSLVLLALPLLFPFAWVAFLVMGAAIAALRLARLRWSGAPARAGSGASTR